MELWNENIRHKTSACTGKNHSEGQQCNVKGKGNWVVLLNCEKMLLCVFERKYTCLIHNQHAEVVGFHFLCKHNQNYRIWKYPQYTKCSVHLKDVKFTITHVVWIFILVNSGHRWDEICIFMCNCRKMHFYGNMASKISKAESQNFHLFISWPVSVLCWCGSFFVSTTSNQISILHVQSEQASRLRWMWRWSWDPCKSHFKEHLMLLWKRRRKDGLELLISTAESVPKRTPSYLDLG